MSISSIRSKLLGKLQIMQTLKAAFDYETSNSNGQFPYGTVSLRGGTGEFRSTAHNQRVQSFWIRIYQERDRLGQGPSSAESIVTNSLDEILTAFDMDTTLSGICKFVQPVRWDTTYITQANVVRLLEVQVEATELVSSV